MRELSGGSRDCFVLRSSQRRKGARAQGAVEVLLVDVGISRNGGLLHASQTQRTVLLDAADFYRGVLIGNLQPPNVTALSMMQKK